MKEVRRLVAITFAKVCYLSTLLLVISGALMFLENNELLNKIVIISGITSVSSLVMVIITVVTQNKIDKNKLKKFK